MSKMRVYSRSLLEDMVEDEAPVKPRGPATTKPKISEKEQQKIEQRRKEQEAYNRSLQKRFREHREKIASKSERKFKSTMKNLEEGFKFIEGDIDPLLSMTAETRWRKKKLLYDRWCKEVFEPIRGQILGELSTQSPEALAARRRELFQEFIDTSNGRKLFRDIPYPDYDPFKAHKGKFKYKTRTLNDPVKKIAKELQKEARMQAGGTIEGRSRDIQDYKTWVKFQDTTVGRLETKPVKPLDPNYKTGDMGQNQYKVSKEQKLVKSEYFPGGLKQFPGRAGSNIPGLSTAWGT